MVRMSDLVRGGSAGKAAPAKEAKEPEEKRGVAPAAGPTVPPALPRTRLAEGPLQSATTPAPRGTPAPAPAVDKPAPPLAATEAVAENAEALFRACPGRVPARPADAAVTPAAAWKPPASAGRGRRAAASRGAGSWAEVSAGVAQPKRRRQEGFPGALTSGW